MYVVANVLLSVVLPIGSGLAQLSLHPSTPTWFVMGRWYVFWAVGIRLLIAGVRQVVRPGLTSDGLMGLKGSEVYFFVRELGFAIIALGTVAAMSLFAEAWVIPCALAGMLFNGLAGLGHLVRAQRRRLEGVAMYTDFLIAVVCLVFLCVAAASHRWPA